MTTPCLMFDPLPDHEHGQDPRTRTVKRAVRAKHALSRIVPRSSYGCAVPGINLNDYSRLPDAKGWGPACQQGRLTITLSNGVRLTVASAIAELVLLVMNEIIRRGYVIRAGDTGAYNCRKIAGTNVWSNHAWAIAIDLNWTTNPYTTGTTHDIPGWVVQLFNRYGFAWGGDYSGSKRDYMHFEFMGNFPTQAAAATALARQELGSGNPTPPTPPPPVDPTAQVKQDQLDLTDTGFPCVADGVWGPASTQACKNFQYSAHLPADGDCGPVTRDALHKVPSWGNHPFYSDGGYLAQDWQKKIKEHGWPITVDNVWGPRSIDLLRQYQADKGLEQTGQGNAQSWTSLWCTVN